MAVTKSFYDAVNEGDVLRVRIMMEDSLLVDPSFSDFSEMEKVASGISDLYVEHDGRSLELNKTQWDDDYMNKIKVQLISNFSHERMDHLKEVVRYLRPVEQETGNGVEERTIDEKNNNKPNHPNCPSGKRMPRESEYQKQKRIDQEEGKFRGAKVAVGVTAGAAVGGAAAAVVSTAIAGEVITGAVVGGAVVGAAIGGAAVYAVTSGEESL